MGIMDKVKDAMPGHNAQQNTTRSGDDFNRPGNDNFNRPGDDNFNNNPTYGTGNTERGTSLDSSRGSDTYGSPKDSMGTFGSDTGMGGNTSMPTGPSGYGGDDTGGMGRGFDSELAGQKRMGGVTDDDMGDRAPTGMTGNMGSGMTGDRASMGRTQDMESGMMPGTGTRGNMTGDEYNRGGAGYSSQAQGYGQSQSDY